jgi:hypothetical protein
MKTLKVSSIGFYLFNGMSPGSLTKYLFHRRRGSRQPWSQYGVTVSNVARTTTSSNAIFYVPIQFTISCTNQSVTYTFTSPFRFERARVKSSPHEGQAGRKPN